MSRKVGTKSCSLTGNMEVIADLEKSNVGTVLGVNDDQRKLRENGRRGIRRNKYTELRK